jgi:hypothetical protein
MNELPNAQLHHLAHDCSVHGILLMDVLRMIHWMDPAAFQAQVERAERELHEAESAGWAAPETHNVLEQRLAYLRAVQIGPTAP